MEAQAMLSPVSMPPMELLHDLYELSPEESKDYYKAEKPKKNVTSKMWQCGVKLVHRETGDMKWKCLLHVSRSESTTRTSSSTTSPPESISSDPLGFQEGEGASSGTTSPGSRSGGASNGTTLTSRSTQEVMTNDEPEICTFWCWLKSSSTSTISDHVRKCHGMESDRSKKMKRKKHHLATAPLEEDLAFIVSSIPTFPFHGIEHFYDMYALVANPLAYEATCQRFLRHYLVKASRMEFDVIGVLATRGLFWGPMLGRALHKKVVVFRSPKKMPNVGASVEYSTEYSSKLQRGGVGSHQAKPVLSVQKDVLHKDERVVLIDDVLATGGTMEAAIQLVHALGAHVLSCGAVLEIDSAGGRQRLENVYPQVEIYTMLSDLQFPHNQVPVASSVVAGPAPASGAEMAESDIVKKVKV